MNDIGKGIGTLVVWAAIVVIVVFGDVAAGTVDMLGFFAIMATVFIWGY